MSKNYRCGIFNPGLKALPPWGGREVFIDGNAPHLFCLDLDILYLRFSFFSLGYSNREDAFLEYSISLL